MNNKSKNKKMFEKRLYRSEKDRIIAGVAGGLAKYFEIDSTLIRLIFALLVVFGGSGVLLYIIFWIVMPTESSVYKAGSEEVVKENSKELERKANQYAKEAETIVESADSKIWFGTILVILGLWLTLSNLGVISSTLIGQFWPLILIFIGVTILIRNTNKSK